MTLEIRPDGGLEHPPEPWRDRARQHLVTSRIAVVAVTRRRAWETWRVTRQLPLAVALLIRWSPRGMKRSCVALWRYLRDEASDELRQHAAREHDAAAAEKAVKVRQVTLRARLLTTSALVVAGVTLVLAWVAPHVLAWVAAAVTLGLMIRALPWRAWQEVPLALGAAGATWWAVDRYAPLLPHPPGWALWLGGAAGVLLCGWAGRPQEGHLVTLPHAEHERRVTVTAAMVTAALVRIGVKGMTEKNVDEIRLLAPGVGRARHGWHLSFELPMGVTAADVMEQREAFAAALRFELGCVWPSQGPRHPGHLSIYISDLPMATAPQPRWSVANGREVDIFEPIDLFTDEEGQWVPATLAYQQCVIGGAPGYGKTFALRQLGVAAAFDPRVRIMCFDGKGNGDLRALRPVAHGFYEGDEPEEIAEQLAAVRGVREEMRRRARFLRELPREENPLSKVTSPLVDRYPHLAPIVLLVDEVQVYTEYDDKEIKTEFIALFTDIVKRGRSAGIIPVFATQKPDSKALPSGIADNCSFRLCFRVNTDKANNQVLGNGMYAMGIRATLFSAKDKGLAWLRGDGSEPQIVRTVYGLDNEVSETLVVQARVIRERRGLLTGEAAGEEMAVVVLDEPADVLRVLAEHARATAHLSELIGWLADLRLDYADIDVDELGKRLRNRGVPTPKVKVAGRTTSGVRTSDLRKHLDADSSDLVNLEDS